MEKAGFTVSTRKWIGEYQALFEEEEERFGAQCRAAMDRGDSINWIGNNFRFPFGVPVTEEDIRLSDTDTCIYVVSRQAGEGADRKLDNGDYQLSELELSNIRLCAASYEKFVLVLNVGGTFDLDVLTQVEGINAVFFYCQQGSEGGRAFADVISGGVSPSGKTVDTWLARYEDMPCAMDYSYLNGDARSEYYREGIYVGYRYADSFGVTPRYCFGYGLSYTHFHIVVTAIDVHNTSVWVRVKVTNVGECYSGKEVVQLYVSCPQGGLTKEYQKLAAFAKTSLLLPGQSEEVMLSVDMANRASYDEVEAALILDEGDYILRLGNSSRHTKPVGIVSLEEKAYISFHDHVAVPKRKLKELKPQAGKQEVDQLAGLPKIIMYNLFHCKHYQYDALKCTHGPKLDELMEKLTLEQKVLLTVGGGMRMMGKGEDGTKPYFMAPGSAGITTPDLQDMGIPNVCMADGPAGLRIQRRSTETADGRVRMIDYQLSTMKYMPEDKLREILGDPSTETMMYQYTTAFPVGMALAQSWNMPLITQVGKCVSVEMRAYGVNYWLAPGMNIHRNPLCGRNFDYFSEDPFLTGKCAAAMTKGVQSLPGNYVTIKHFCCNNQEEERNYTDAVVSERALREIYLKGFEICVREAAPGAVMTSYNLVNGTYVNNSYELMTKVLRNEWNFGGFVMTDWMATGVVGVSEPVGSDVLAVKNGNDLLMPGNEQAIEALQLALQDGSLKEAEVEKAAANVLKGILSTEIYQEFVGGRK
mgnify:CR=1 FL=1